MDHMYNSRKSASQNARFVNLVRFPSQGTKHRSSFYWQVNMAEKYTAFGGDGNDRRRGCGNPYRPSCHGRNSIKVGEVHPQSHRRRILSSPTGLWRSQMQVQIHIHGQEPFPKCPHAPVRDTQRDCESRCVEGRVASA